MQLYGNSRVQRLRFLQVALWLAPAFFAWLAWATRIEDPRNNHAASLILALILAVFAFGYEIFLRHYVTAIWQTTSDVVVETISTFGRSRRHHPANDLRLGPEIHSDGLSAATMRQFHYGNSHQRLYAKDRRFPYVVDTTADPPPNSGSNPGDRRGR
jgi:hypothetical protein